MEKKKESFVKQMFNIGIGTLITILMGVITTPIITRLVAPKDYGDFALFNTYTTLGYTFLNLGLDQAFLRFYYQDTRNEKQIKLLKSCLKILLYVYLAVIIIVCLLWVSGALEKINNTIIFFYVLMIGILVLNRFALLNLRVEYKTLMYSIVNCLTKFSYVILVLAILFVKQENKLYALIVAHFLSVALATIVAMLAERKNWKFKRIQNVELDFSMKEIVSYGIPLMISTSIFSLFQASDRIALSYFCDKSVVGVYASAQSLMIVFSVIQQSFNVVWAPKAIEKYEGEKENNTYYQKVNHMLTVCMFAFGATVLLLKEVFVLFLGEEYRQAVTIIPFLVLNPIMYTISETTNIGIVIKKKPIYQVYTVIIACACNAIGNFMLIPIWGVNGAAISTGTSYILFFSLRTLFSKKFVDIDYSLKKFYGITICFWGMAYCHSMYQNRIAEILLYFAFMILLIYLYRKTVKEILDFGKCKLLGKK